MTSGRILLFLLLLSICSSCNKKQIIEDGPEILKQYTQWVYEGDSITGIIQFPHNYPYQLTTLYRNIANSSQVNVAESGDRIAFMIDEYAVQVHPFAPVINHKSSLFILMAGTNDAINGRASTQIYNDLKTEWNYAKADGFKVVAMCITRTTDPVRDSINVAVNKLILSDTNLYDYVVRTDLLLPDPYNSSDFRDGLHPTDNGSTIIAKEIVRVLSQ